MLLFCWVSTYRCLAKIAGGGVAAVLVVPHAIAAAGFTSAGVAAGSLAAWAMSCFGGTVPAWIAALQSAGTAGVGIGWNAALFTGAGGALLLAAEELGCVKTVCCLPGDGSHCICDPEEPDKN